MTDLSDVHSVTSLASLCMSEHFRTHLTEHTHREHVRESLRTTKLLECEDCKIRFMKMEDLRVAHDNIKNLDKSKYDIDAFRPRLENCNLFKNYEFFIRNIEVRVLYCFSTQSGMNQKIS